MRVVCGKGTYVRSLADDIAAALGGRAHLISLRRTRVGGFTLDQALDLDEIENRWPAALVSPGRGLAHLPAVTVSDQDARSVSHGVRFAHRLMDDVGDEAFCVLGDDGRLLAVYRNDRTGSRAEVVMA